MYIQALMERGLSESEANEFIQLLKKITSTDEDVQHFYKEMGEPIPFEGGMFFNEALTGLKLINVDNL